jgi:hypothetical protein
VAVAHAATTPTVSTVTAPAATATPRTRRGRLAGPPVHDFRNRLLLNQWMISQFGVDPFQDYQGRRPFQVLAERIRTTPEGLGPDNRHHFYAEFLAQVTVHRPAISAGDLLRYEDNLVVHTQAINSSRQQLVVWKHFQWLSLLFLEHYLDRYFGDANGLLADLNSFRDHFNTHHAGVFAPVAAFTRDNLNKICLQNATGSGKTLLMHVNIRQYIHYATQAGRTNELTRVLLLTPSESLTDQHLFALKASGIECQRLTLEKDDWRSGAKALNRVEATEITKLGDKMGPNTIAVDSLTDANLVLVDEGHRGMSASDEGAWFARRAKLSQRGFVFEYSATFTEAINAAGNGTLTDAYAASVLVDYSYRYFYEDGFGKDYRILNLPRSFEAAQDRYLTACLLAFYQQSRFYAEQRTALAPFNLEAPLLVWVGSTVSGKAGRNDGSETLGDVATVLAFLAKVLAQRTAFQREVQGLLTGDGAATGLVDRLGRDIFHGAFAYLQYRLKTEGIDSLYTDLLTRLFHGIGTTLVVDRLTGSGGEILLHTGNRDQPFGLINVGDAKRLCDHLTEHSVPHVQVTESQFGTPQFGLLNDPRSPYTMLIGAKKFIEGWDCWRVSTMGLMRVGQNEGSQIIQLFGRGVRLKGHGMSLKRSAKLGLDKRPKHIELVETLNVFGIGADFMDRFKKYLEDEGLPGNEQCVRITIPLQVTYDVGRELKILAPKRKKSDGQEYSYGRDGRVPVAGQPPTHWASNKVVCDWWPRLTAHLKGSAATNTIVDEHPRHLDIATHGAFLDWDRLWFEVEAYKRSRSWTQVVMTPANLSDLLRDPFWYDLRAPEDILRPSAWSRVELWQQMATELCKRYLDRFVKEQHAAFIEPRLEVRLLDPKHANLDMGDSYVLTIGASEAAWISDVERLRDDLATNKKDLVEVGQMRGLRFTNHLYQPLLRGDKEGRVSIAPVSLNESEYEFIHDLYQFYQAQRGTWASKGWELYLLRNLSRSKGLGFFEARGFHPDFILWMVNGTTQHLIFVDPHGMLHEGIASPKVQFHKTVKNIEARLGDPNLHLHSFILSPTEFGFLAKHGHSKTAWEAEQVLFMKDGWSQYVSKLFDAITSTP